MNTETIDQLAEKVAAIVKERMGQPSFEVEASGRHIHLSEADLKFLLGDEAELVPVKYLSQPGQYASQVRLTILGPKGAMHNVVVLGPTRKETQVEISMTDATQLGVKAPVRLSGDTAGTPGITIINGNKSLTIDHGTIVAKRHIHVKTQDAKALGVTDKEVVKVKIDGARPLIFDDVVVRIHDNFSTAMHIDYDEANACGFKKGMRATIVKG